MATENGSEQCETFNICFGGVLGVGKTTLFEYLKSGKFVERGSDEAGETGVDVSRLEREVDGTKIKVRGGRHTCRSQLVCVFLLRAVLPFITRMRVGARVQSDLYFLCASKRPTA